MYGNVYDNRVSIGKIMEEVLFKRNFSIVERKDAKRLVTGIVADPENVDCYGNMLSPDTIERAAYNFMENFMFVGVEHEVDEEGNPKLYNDVIKIVENWVTRESGKLGEIEYPASTWIQTFKVLDNNIWDRVVRGELTGFSFEAYARKVPIKEEVEDAKE